MSTENICTNTQRQIFVADDMQGGEDIASSGSRKNKRVDRRRELESITSRRAHCGRRVSEGWFS